MITHTLESTVEKIHFTSETGLVFCDRLNGDIHISERYHIQEKAAQLDEVKAVLFRRKYNEDSEIIDSKPSLYIYEKDNEFFNSSNHKDLHAKIWSAGDIDVYIIVSTTRIDIINARKPAEIKNDDLDLENLRLISNALEQFNDQRFSAFEFIRGTFWEQADFFDPQQTDFYKNRLKEENTPFHQLLEYLMVARKHLHNQQQGLFPDTIDKLLIVCILVKFLEEIKDDNGKHTLREIYSNHEIENFAEALEGGTCLSILSELSREFNGNIFDNFSDEEKSQIRETNLTLIADFLRADIDLKSGQYFLWRQYSFSHLPVELISAIYERFLPQEKGVVYTPPFLVNFLIDEVMPIGKATMHFSQNEFQVLDPSCGSGVFLVAAYKRMLQWWSINDYVSSNRSLFSKPPKTICQEILENNIWGVDIHPTATLITVFSLTIALLDKLEPKEIWNNLKLNNLQENIQTKNFFEWATVAKKSNRKFDLIVGNPPFNPKSGIAKKDAVSESQIRQFGISNKDIPRNNFALKFFEGAMFFGQRACLILPSNILLYDKAKTTQDYRARIFTQFTIEKIFDFTHLRRILFGSVDTPVSAIVANPAKSQGRTIQHIVIKRLSSIEKNVFLEIDHYDYHVVPHNWTIDPAKQFVWKTNLLGGGRLFHFIYRLSLFENLNSFIKSKKEWIFQDGYKNILKNSSNTVSYIYNRDKVSAIKNGTIISGEKETNKDFKRPRPRNLYQLPLLIIHKKIGERHLPIGIKKTHTDDYLVFNSSFAGIHAPEQDFGVLKNIYARLNKYSDTYLLYILATSPSVMVGQETAIKKTDLDTLPFPTNEESLNLSEPEKFIQEDVLDYYIHSAKAISGEGEGKKLHEQVGEFQLRQFGQVFCDTLNSIYAKNGKSWQYGSFAQTNSFTIFQLGYGINGGLPFQRLQQSDAVIRPLIYDSTSHRGAVFTRVARIYKHINDYDCVFLIKPSAIRYWLNSIALRDADETFADLREAGR